MMISMPTHFSITRITSSARLFGLRSIDFRSVCAEQSGATGNGARRFRPLPSTGVRSAVIRVPDGGGDAYARAYYIDYPLLFLDVYSLAPTRLWCSPLSPPAAVIRLMGPAVNAPFLGITRPGGTG